MKHLLISFFSVVLFSIINVGSSVSAQEADQAGENSSPDEYRFKNKARHHKKMGKELLEKIDANEDGKVDLDEYLAHSNERFTRMDIDGDGYVVAEEMREAHKQMRKEQREARKAEREAYKKSMSAE